MKTPVLVAVGAVDAIIAAMHSPSKADELAILRDCIAKLGPNSYCGHWLAQQIDAIESDIRSDIFPQINMAESKTQCADLVASAKLTSERMISDALAKAKAKENEIQLQLNGAYSALRHAMRVLEDR